MKKTMIFTLILMPLIVLGILLLSGNIVNMSTYLYVEYLEFVEDEIVLQKDTADSVSGEVKVNVFPLLANNKEVEFWSDNENIVTVNSKGKIVGVDFGETYIHAKSKENGTKTAYCKVRVTSARVHSLSLSETQKNMYVGDTYKLNVVWVPSDAIDVELDYVSSDPSVATVAKSGVVTVVGGGETTITAYLHSNPNLSVSLRISAKPHVSGMEIEKGKDGDEFSSKTSFVFPNVELSPSGASEKISYRVADVEGQNVATVDENGNITFSKAGTINVTAYIAGTNIEVTKKYTSTFGKFSSISFSIDSPTNINFADYENDEELVLKYSYAPLDMDASKLNIVVTDESGLSSEVIKLENGKLKVKRGGRATVTISGGGVDGVISDSSTITVNRTATIIGFTGNDFKGGAKFAYAGSDGITLDASSLPEDANDEITYSLSDDSVAEVKSGKLIFKDNIIASGYGKVTVTARTDKGVTSSVVVMYIGESLEKIDISRDLDDADTICLNMRKSGEGVRKFALIDEQVENFEDVQFVLSGSTCLEQMGTSPVFTLKDKGTAQITVSYLKNGKVDSTKTVTVVINRLVESIDNLKVKASWGEDKSTTFDITNDQTSVYSTAKEFEILYTLTPNNATATTAILSVESCSEDGIALINGHKVTFSGIGDITILVEVDGICRKVVIHSTYLHPDDTTSLNVKEIHLSHDNNDTCDLYNYVSMLDGVNKEYITFEVTGNSITIQNNIVSTRHGGVSKVKVYADTGDTQKKYLGEISISVSESAKTTITTSGEYFFADSNVFDFGSLFAFSPSTATGNSKLYYNIISGGNVATLDGSKLSFSGAGSCTVMARLNGQSDGAKITVVYTGNSTVLDIKDIVIIKGTTVMLKPSSTALSSASYDQKFVSSTKDIALQGAKVTVNGSGKVTFGDEEFNFVCLSQNTISLMPKNSGDYTLVGGVYETGKTELDLEVLVGGDGKLPEYVSSGYATLTYGEGVKVEDNCVIFDHAGTYSPKLTLAYANSVVGGESNGMSCAISIRTTYGVANITKKSGVSTEKVFDEENSLTNYFDLNDYLNISPKPFVLDESVQVEVTKASRENMVTVDGLKLKFNAGGEFEIKVTNKTTGTSLDIIKFTVNRIATGISLDGTELKESGKNEVVGNRATIYVNPIAMPLDANQKRIISWEITKDDGSVAEKPSTNDRIVFSKAGESIEVTFTLESGKTFVVSYMTTDVMYEVDIESQTIIAPVGEPFTFISSTGRLDPSKIEFTGTVDGVEECIDDRGSVYYKFTKSFSKDVNIKFKYDTEPGQEQGKEETIKRRAISVSDKQSILDGEIKIVDQKPNGESVELSTKQEHSTASSSITLKFMELDEFGADGERLAYNFKSSDENIATIDNGVIVFKKAGSVTITASITYKILPLDNASAVAVEETTLETKVLEYSFVVSSTYGRVTGFDGVTLSYTYLYDTMENKSIDLLKNIARVAPTYGVSSDTPSVSVNGTCASWSGSNLNIVGSGTSSVMVTYGTMQKEVSIKIDKYIDSISILENSTNKGISQVVTKDSSYKFNYVFNNLVTPTLLDLDVVLKIDGVDASASGYVSLEDGVATLKGLERNKKYSISLNAKDGGASASLEVITISDDVNVVDLGGGTNRDIVLVSGQKYIFEDRYNTNIYNIIDHNNVVSVDQIGVFKVAHGDEGTITLGASGASDIGIHYVATESVKSIVLGDSAWEDNHLTAMGSKADGLGIDLKEVYAPSIKPTTARTFENVGSALSSKAFEVKFEILGGNDIASIENGVLYFTAQGAITIKISTTDEDGEYECITRKITSTLGYYKSLTASVSFDGETKDSYVFDYSTTPKTPTIKYTYLPSDIDLKSDKAKISIISTDESVFEWKENGVRFVGGGSAKLRFGYSTSQTQTKTQDIDIYVLNKATSVTITVDGKGNNYMVTKYGENESLQLGYTAVANNGATLSPYNAIFTSSDEKVATVDDNGKVSFVGNGQVVITIKVASEKNESGVYDATDTITIVNNKDYEIVSLDLSASSGGEASEEKVETLRVGKSNYVLYPSSSDDNYTSYAFEVESPANAIATTSLRTSKGATQRTSALRGVSENDILSVNELGEITLKGKGGYVTILVTATKPNGGKDTFTLNFYVWKEAQIKLAEGKNNVYTALTEWNVAPIVIVNNGDGSMVDKTIEYKVASGGSFASVSADGKVTFTGAGKATMRVSVVYGGKEEVGVDFVIESTFGKATSFDLYKVTGGTEGKISNEASITLKTKDKNAIKFAIKNILPTDVTAVLDIENNNSGFGCTPATDQIGFTLTGLSATTDGQLKVGVSGSGKYTLKVSVIQLAESIDITLNEKVISSRISSSFASTIELGYKLDSNNVSDQSATWTIVSGEGASLNVSGKVCVLTLSSSDVVTIKVTSGDGEVSATASFQMTDITGFSLNSTAYTTISGGTYNGYVYVEHSTDTVSLGISLLGDINGFDGWGYFSGSSTNGSGVSIDKDNKQVVITLKSYADTPEVSDTITITYKNSALTGGVTYTQTISVYRDGIRAFEFRYGNQKMDETLTNSAGLQQMLLFGNQSYYGGVQNYYNMNTKSVSQADKEFTPSTNAIVWKATRGDNDVNWEVSYSGGVAKLDTSGLSVSSLDEVYNDNFTSGEITLSAYRVTGKLLSSYTFHFVSGVNVWTETDFWNAGDTIVMHDKLVLAKTGSEPAQIKETIYGNGNLLDLSARNSKNDNKYENDEYVRVQLPKGINLSVNGSTQNDSIVQLCETQMYAYCQFKYLYRFIPGYDCKLKRSLFTSFKYAGIFVQLGNENTAEENLGKCFIEDLLMFNVGPRGIEVQFGYVYAKGFLDVYNYQNEKMAKEAFGDISKIDFTNRLGQAIMEMANEYTVDRNGDTWVNMVGVSTKGSDRKIFYWDRVYGGENDSLASGERKIGNDVYVDTDDVDHKSASGLVRMTKKINLVVKTYYITAWVYGPSVLPWETQYDSTTGSLNDKGMSQAAEKLYRIPTTSTTTI